MDRFLREIESLKEEIAELGEVLNRQEKEIRSLSTALEQAKRELGMIKQSEAKKEQERWTYY